MGRLILFLNSTMIDKSFFFSSQVTTASFYLTYFLRIVRYSQLRVIKSNSAIATSLYNLILKKARIAHKCEKTKSEL